jgi:hypothetical protein
MALPEPRKSAASHFYKYRSPAQLGWLKETLHSHEIYLPNLTELNDDNDGLPHLAQQTEQEMADFLWSRFRQANLQMSQDELSKHEAIIRFNVRFHGPTALHPNLVQLLDDQLKDFRVYSMAKRYDMGNLWALYADGHRGCCLEFENVGPLFEHAMDVSYLEMKDMEVGVNDAGLLKGYFLFCKTREWRCEEEVRLVLSRNDGRSKVKLADPRWVTKIILGKGMSEENKNLISVWAKERKPELDVATTFYDPISRSIKLRTG